MLTDLTRVVPEKPNVHMDRVKCLIDLGRLEEAQKVLDGEHSPLANYPPRSKATFLKQSNG